MDAQKQVDEYNRPNTYTHMYYLAEEGRPRAFNSFTCVNSYFKHRPGGAGSSFKSARYYSDQARERRDKELSIYHTIFVLYTSEKTYTYLIFVYIN